MTTEADRNREISPKEEEFVAALINGLKSTYLLHEKLGDMGKTVFQQNKFGETALVMDVQAEEAVIDSFRERNISFQVFSEEHGEFIVGRSPRYLVVVDGLDGSDAYKKERGKAMYGTMAGILGGANSIYGDYLVSGIMIHSPIPKLFLAIKGKGCFLIDVATGERKALQKPSSEGFSKRRTIDLDINWPPYGKLFNTWHEKFPGLQCAHFSAAARCALFIQDDIDVALEFTRKSNLELAVMYGLVREVGGVMVMVDGEDIGNKPYRTFEQTRETPLIIASTKSSAEQVSKKLKLKNISIPSLLTKTG